MSAEEMPGSVETEGTVRVTLVPHSANPKSAAILNGGTAIPITYALIDGGLDHSITETTKTDARFTKKQIYSKLGKTTDALAISYVWGGADDEISGVVVEGSLWWCVIRDIVPNETDYAASQKIDILEVEAGRPKKNRVGDFHTKTQTLSPVGDTQEDVTVVS